MRLCLQLNPDARLNKMEATLEVIKIDRMPAQDFAIIGEDVVRAPIKKHRGENYEAEHMELFRTQAYTWPPDASIISEHFAEFAETLSTRQKEALFYIAKKFPKVQTDSDPDYVDINTSLLRLVTDDGTKNPWKKICPTLTTSTKAIGGPTCIRQSVVSTRFSKYRFSCIEACRVTYYFAHWA